ncbi:uncharacterized protein TRIVIDRAFT_227323 [Trichoderma virens Gv29-8]|uniref:Uncharacterized protein n=1 Tax=Hypocrea virens (strain Gv29-8 / FGSC 10586) TaxID=413071 RepID=G9N936_HYPVG|nr:uncharacterized protein TRIVIDRAFT_227323 [Trichoderma virens Gv29-8]EHK16458.1 hypothetical protein TRIVIDRAFT_227323 [Trichoderma virens Gv29-8]UKZ52165.1 hypothetical protein TrVGV298_005940 [Trichoderma virens]
MAAAAYAKDLLYRIPPTKIEAEKRILDIISGVREGVDKLLHTQRVKEQETILNWLSPVNYTPLQMDYIRKRQPGTGNWFLESAEYQAWLKTDKQTLFCPGIPGAGKTIITAIVIDDLHKGFQNNLSVGITYLYCDFRRRHEQTIEDLLLNLVKQFARQHTFVPIEIQQLYEKCKKENRQPSFDEISQLLHSVSKLYSKAIIVIGALDECQSDLCRTRLLTEVFKLQDKTSANVFLTARLIPGILEILKESVSLEIRAQDEDVQRYIKDQITRLPSFVLNNYELQDKIKTTISKAVDGMFLLAPLHMEALAREPTTGYIEIALHSLPEGLEAVYKRAMIRIESLGKSTQELAKTILSWIVHAKRTLSISELQHAVAVKPGESELNSKFIPSIETIGTICAGLITIDIPGNTVRLVHYTTQEYFERTHEMWFPNSKSNIKTICITYLSFSAFESGYCSTDAEFQERLRSNPFYNYAACNWGHFARETSICGQETIKFLKCDAKVEASSQALMKTRLVPGDSKGSYYFPKGMRGLHLTAYFGIEEAAKALLDSYHPNGHDSFGRTPLSYAAENGNESVARLLLATGRVSINYKDRDEETPLSRSLKNGHEAMVKLLLAQNGIDPNPKRLSGTDFYGQDRTPLSFAAESGNTAAVKKLLATKGVDINIKARTSYGDHGRTPLSYAAGEGHEEVVKLLLAMDNIDPDLGTSRRYKTTNRTPLSFAAQSGHTSVVKLLLGCSAVDPDSRAGGERTHSRTPLSYAAENGHEAIVRLLLATGKIDVNIEAGGEYNTGRTALSYAAEKGHEAVVALLLATKNINSKCRGSPCSHSGRTGRTALSYAACEGHAEVMRLLLTIDGIDVNSKDFTGRTALSLAAENGHEPVVRLLLRVDGVDVNSRNNHGETALSLAVKNGHKAVVRLLRRVDGVDLSSKDNGGQAFLSLAIEELMSRW